ncbi:cysteine proteinase [Auricularia subglabra TFB-10046 SS5]|nr:cysteine proteinase [Auricularia subglabra TFB-10046 SS5]
MSATALKAARDTATKAAAKELEGHIDAAFELYISAARAFLNIANTSPELKVSAKAEANKALERAEKIKSAKSSVKPVAKDPLSEDEQAHILRRAARIHGITYAPWNLASADRELRDCADASYQDPDGQPQILAGDHTVVWRRINSTVLASSDLLPSDIVQTVVGNCSVVASLAVCLQHQRQFGSNLVLSSLHPHDQNSTSVLSPSGAYAYSALLNGCRRCVIIDDHLPVSDPAGELLCASTGSKQVLWPSLVEKAYMKAVGGYMFEGSNSCIDLHALVGWIPEHIPINSPTFRKEQVFLRVLEGFAAGKCLVTLGTGRSVARLHWLIASHDYAVLDISEERIVRILDPLLAEGNQSRVRDISWDDLCAYFESLYVSWDPGSFAHQKSVHGVWPGAQDSSSESTQNQQVRLSLETGDEDTELWVLLTRHLPPTHDTPPAFISAHALQKHSFSSLRDIGQLGGAYTDSPHALVRLQPGPLRQSYIMVASRQSAANDATFTLSLYSNRAFTVETTRQSALYVRKIESSFILKNAGGNPLNATFMNNPQWKLCLKQKADLRLSVTGPKELSLNVKAIWGAGDRITDITEGDIVVDSGTYRYGIAYAEKEVQAGDYTLVISSFKPKELGAFLLTVESSVPFSLDPVPQEGSGMYAKTLTGSWAEATAGGPPSSGRYHLNPFYDVRIASTSDILARLQLTSRSPNAAINLTLFEWDEARKKLGRQIATSGPYAERVSGALIQHSKLQPGRYCLVPSTYVPGLCINFRLVVYSTAPKLQAALR